VCIELDGTDLRRLAADPARRESVSRIAGNVVIVGSKLIVSDFSDNNFDLMAVKADGSTPPLRVASLPNNESAFDVVGERVVFPSNVRGPDGIARSHLFSQRLAGGDLVELAAASNEQLVEYAGHLGERVFINLRQFVVLLGHVNFIASVNADGTDKVEALAVDAILHKVTGDRLIFHRRLNNVEHLFGIAANGQGDAIQLTTDEQPSYRVRVVGEPLVIARDRPAGSEVQVDLYALRLTAGGAQEVPLATSVDSESFEGSAKPRVVFTRSVPRPGQLDREEVHSVALDGTGPRRLLTDSPDAEFVESVRKDGRVIVRRTLPPADGSASALQQLVVVNIDGSHPDVLGRARNSVRVLDD
jgi:hypothetical protein